MNRFRRFLTQLLLPSPQYDFLTDTYLVPVSATLLEELGEWSRPLHVKVERGPQWPGVRSDFQLVCREAR